MMDVLMQTSREEREKMRRKIKTFFHQMVKVKAGLQNIGMTHSVMDT